MRFVAAVLLVAFLDRPATADPLCVAVLVTLGGRTEVVAPDCGDVPVPTLCRAERVWESGTGTEVSVLLCLPG